MNVQPIVDAIRQRAAETAQSNGKSSMTLDSQPLAKYGLDGVSCAVCGNTGSLWRQDENGVLWARECGCMTQRRSIKRMKRSGLSDLAARYTLDNYLTPDEKRSAIKDAALRFLDDNSGSWWFVAGKPGSGKTHICVAICGELLKRVDVRYFLWRDEVVKLKAAVTDREAYAQLRSFAFREVKVVFQQPVQPLKRPQKDAVDL